MPGPGATSLHFANEVVLISHCHNIKKGIKTNLHPKTAQ